MDNNKQWYQLKISGLDEAQLELLSEALAEFNALSIAYTDAKDDPIFEPELNTTPLWQQTVLTVLFDDETLNQAGQHFLQENYPNANVIAETLADKDWLKEGLKGFEPMCFGKRLWICPSHCRPPKPDAINVLLDPGLAFGTGTHPTTAMCLAYLDSAEITGKAICDYGTGSGILAISALKLGAEKVYAVDIDPQAVIATKQNAEANNLSTQQLAVDLVDNLAIPNVDVVVANILAGPLVELAPTLLDLLAPGGKLILSGLLKTQLAEIEQAYQASISNFDYQTMDDWALCTMEKSGKS